MEVEIVFLKNVHITHKTVLTIICEGIKKEMLTLCNTQHHYFHVDNVLLQKSSNFEEVYLKNGKKD